MVRFLLILLLKKRIFLEQLYPIGLKNTGMSKLDQIKKLKERIEELEFVKDFQQDIITDMELITGVDMSKKSLPKTFAKEIALKKKNRLKENGAISVLGLVNKASAKDVNYKKSNK
jgi:transposase